MIVLAVIAAVILASAAVAFALRSLVHSALLLVLTWLGVAAFYLWAGADFVAFAQILIYVGAISMVVLFAVLLTRRPASTPDEQSNLLGYFAPASFRRALGALAAGAAVTAVIAFAILRTPFPAAPTAAPALTVRQLGLELMGPHAAALLVVGVILTVALLGATLIASTDRPAKPEDRP